MDDSSVVAATADVPEVCGARMVHLEHLREHGAYEELDLSQGVKPLSIRWVEKDDYHTAKARLTT